MIPKGEYGGGTMIVWDQGRWRPEGDPRKAYAKGHLDFSLEAQRLKGRWHLVRMRPRPHEKKEQWLLIKGDDEFARAPTEREITDEETTSILSGRTNDELATAGEIRGIMLPGRRPRPSGRRPYRAPRRFAAPRRPSSGVRRTRASLPSPIPLRAVLAGSTRSSLTAIVCRLGSTAAR